LRKGTLGGGAALGIALLAALAFESVYDVRMSLREDLQPASRPSHAPARTSPDRRGSAPLPLRLVDSGGVGVPLGDEWGSDYSHDLRAFREVILKDAPYVDDTAFRRVEGHWRAYVERMLDYGNNAIAMPLLLELINFDRVNGSRSGAGSSSVYAPADGFAARHAAVRRYFRPLVDWTDRRGMQVFLSTDMLALTTPLYRYLRALAPNRGAVGINTSDPAVWDVYRAGLEELFDAMPSLDGVVIRVGEAGSLYNTDGWDYRSAMAVRDAASLRAMLRGLLPLFEARGKTLVLRSWTVGVGPIGRLHVDPRVYEAVLGDIESPALIVSTKYTAGDFFSYLPVNQTLTGGRHRRLVELQARPEFEGSGAFPNFLGDEYAQALRTLTAANPRIVGMYLWSQLGGPLRAGPRSLYPVHGFWLWTDANVFVASRIGLDRDADVKQLARKWAADRFGADAQLANVVTGLLTDTRDAVRTGFYIRRFAQRDVRVAGLELPPLMWIFDWDRIGGWHSLLSIVYQGSRDAVDVALDEGDSAADRVRRARGSLQAALDAAGPDACAQFCDEARRSLEYQETLFDALAAWRHAFLNYYRWLETGDASAWTQWTVGRERFKVAEARHVERFGSDDQFPAFDLTSAEQAVAVATRSGPIRGFAAALLVAVIALLGVGRAQPQPRGKFEPLARAGRVTWTAAVAPWRLGREPSDLRMSVAVAMLSLTLVWFVAGALAGFTTWWISAGAVLVIGSVGLAFETTAIRVPDEKRGRLLVAAFSPLIPGLIVLLALVAYRGPLGFWYGFWISPIFRVIVLTTIVASVLWTPYAMIAAHRTGAWHERLGGSLAAVGVGILAAALLLPDWLDVLRFLDRPLNFAPATETMLIALRTYVGVSLDAGAAPWVVGTLLVGGGFALSPRGRTSR
jgi:hypothetical protein